MIAKQIEGFKEGRPRLYIEEQLENALDLLNNHSYKQISIMTGINVNTLLRAKKIMNNVTESN